MRKTLPILVAVLLLAAGFGTGWFASTHFSGAPTSPQSEKPAPQSERPALSFRIGDPELLTPAPSWETWKYPGSNVESSNTPGGSVAEQYQMEFGATQRIVLVTRDEFDKVWAFYKEKCQIPENLGGGNYDPISQHGRSGKSAFIKLRNDVQAVSFAVPKSDALTARAFTVHSLRYQLVGFVYRPKGAESTCILLAYRPTNEFVSLLKDRVVKE